MVRKAKDLAFNVWSCQLFSSETEEHERFFFMKGEVTLKVAKGKTFKGLMFL